MSYLPLVFLGGGIGACLRVLLGQLISFYSVRIWTGTFFVNILGCLIYFSLSKWGVDSKTHDFLIKAGILGSLTTFSTFSYEVIELIKLGRPLEALLAFFLNIFFGLVIGLIIYRSEIF